MPQVTMSPEQLQEILKNVLAHATKLNPLEQKKFDEELAKDRRRDLLAVQLSKAEEAAKIAKRQNCSHMRYNASSGKLAGQSAPKGSPNAEWTTGGQAHQNGLAHMFCSRCQSEWWFEPTPDYYQMIVQNGLEGIAPPPDDQTVCIGCREVLPKCRCNEIAKEYVNAHPTVS